MNTVSTFIHPCPERIASAVMELLEDWQHGEITPDEYNRRFAELQDEAKRDEIGAMSKFDIEKQ